MGKTISIVAINTVSARNVTTCTKIVSYAVKMKTKCDDNYSDIFSKGVLFR